MSDRLDAMDERCTELINLIRACFKAAAAAEIYVETIRSDIVNLRGEEDSTVRTVDPLKAPEVEGADRDGDGGTTVRVAGGNVRIELDE